MADLDGALQKALFDRLSAQITDVTCYQHPPQNVARPIILIAQITLVRDGGKDGGLFRAVFSIQCETKGAGLAKLSALRGRTRAALEGWRPAETEGVLIAQPVLISSAGAIRFEDEDVYYGQDSYLTFLQPAD